MTLRPLLLIFSLAFGSLNTATAEETVRPSFLPEKLEDAKGRKMDSTDLNGKYIGLYFSASWCGPCRAFTPRLKAFRDRHLEDGFEIVLINFDKTNTEKRRYVKDSGMEWPSVQGASRKPSKSLAETYQVKGYPTLIILDPKGRVITYRGVEEVLTAPELAFAQWKESTPPDA